jgi:hypothetical protein
VRTLLVIARRYGPIVLPLDSRERQLAHAVRAFPRPVRSYLLKLLLSSPDQRAAAIGRLHQERSTRPMAEFLMDLEEDRLTAMDVAEALKNTRHGWK